MPLYSYKCEKCHKDFEEFYTSFSKVNEEEAGVSCPSCGSTEKRRNIPTSTSFQLKGGGWFKSKYEKRGGKP